MSMLGRNTANQVSEKWVQFLKDCSAYGDTVLYTEIQVVGGDYDPITDRIVGGVDTPVTQTFVKGALAAPVKVDEGGSTDRMGESMVMGHKLGGVIYGESYIARVKQEMPLTPTGVYAVNGINYKFSRLLDTMRVGKRVMWNLVLFVRG